MRMLLFQLLVSFSMAVSFPDKIASVVLGQEGSYTTIGENFNGTVGPWGFNSPTGIFVENGVLYVSDSSNDRVLKFAIPSMYPFNVLGQVDMFSNSTTVNAETLGRPYNVKRDASGSLLIAESGADRVSVWAEVENRATFLIGQDNPTDVLENKGMPQPDATSLSDPEDVAITQDGVIFVVDKINNRVLGFQNSASKTAFYVFGQPNFTSASPNRGLGIPSNDSLNEPRGLCLDSQNNLYISDYENNRVLMVPYLSTVATRVYCQGGNFSRMFDETTKSGCDGPRGLFC